MTAFFENTHASAVQIAVRRHGRFVYSKAFGSEDPAGVSPASRVSLFQIGSNSKKATALAVLRAVQDGALELDDTIDQALPELKLARDPEWTKHATVRHLLSHQSGLWDFTPWFDAPGDDELSNIVYGTFAEHAWSTTPPGAVWNYSNPNFSLLGAVLERVYGLPYRTVIEREVYRPLRLRHTYARREEAAETGHAVWGYGAPAAAFSSPDYDPWQLYAPAPTSGQAPPSLEWVAPGAEEDNAFVRPAGLTWSTAEDECRVGAFLIAGQPRFLDERLHDELLSPQAQTSPNAEDAAYSFGLALHEHVQLGPDEGYDMAFLEHSGATVRMSSEFFAFPEQDLTFSVLTNSTLGNDTESLAWQMLLVSVFRAYVALPAAHPVPAPEPPDDGARYAGTYVDPNGLGTIVLSWDGSKLTISAPDVTAQGAHVDENVIIAQKNILIGSVDGQQIALQVWPSSDSDAAYLVSRLDSFSRVATP